MSQRATTVLTISRHLGSGGSYIGQEVARRLGMRYADREILRGAAASLGANEADLEAREETVVGFWESVLRSFSLGGADTTFAPPSLAAVYERDVFALESRVIREIASRFDAVIVGRCGFHVLADHPGTINVMVHAPKAWRRERVMQVFGIAEAAQADELIERSDFQRGRFIRTFTGREWTDALAFHLCIDTSLTGLDLASDLVTSLVSRGRKRLAGSAGGA